MAKLTFLKSAIRLVFLAFFLTLFKLTKTILDKSPIMAMTTKSSIRVNPFSCLIIIPMEH